jgi:hypothetical protein
MRLPPQAVTAVGSASVAGVVGGQSGVLHLTGLAGRLKLHDSGDLAGLADVSRQVLLDLFDRGLGRVEPGLSGTLGRGVVEQPVQALVARLGQLEATRERDRQVVDRALPLVARRGL